MNRSRSHPARTPAARRVPAIALAIALVLGAALFGLACARERPRNLVLISLDTLVPGRMSVYGGERETTPAIDALSAHSLRFTNAFSTSPWTLPAHASMLLGRYPTSLAPDPNDRRLYRLAPSLATLFRDGGYRTLAVTGGGFVAKAFGANTGFDRFIEHKRWTDRSWNPASQAATLLEEVGDAPFFLFFHTYEAHVVYDDRRYADALDGGRIESIFQLTREGLEIHRDVCCGGMELTPEEQAFLVALYDGGVARADEIVAELLATLERLGLAEDTAIVITSDHGEEFHEHTTRAAYHGHSLYDELLRIPLIWYEPDLPAAGRVADEMVSLLDIVPTAIARFGLERPPGLDGVDLSPLLDGDPWEHERVLFGEGVQHGPSRFAVMTGAGKLIVTPDPSIQQGEGRKFPVPVRAPRELYVAGDTGETDNRIDDAGALRAELEGLLARHREAAVAEDPTTPALEVDVDTRERLRELGYTE